MLADKKNGYLIINTGTPDEPTIPALRRYLKEFLSDPDMLDYPSTRPSERSRFSDKIKNSIATILRWMIVNLIVVPFRPKKIIKKYSGIWTDQGSPLLVNSIKFAEKLKNYTNGNVQIGMRYGNPSIKDGIKKLKENGTEKLGGESLKLIPSLNDDEEWVRSFSDYLNEKEELLEKSKIV